jgi:hypothetical protein
MLTAKYLISYLFLTFLPFHVFSSDFPDPGTMESFFHIDSDSGIKGPPYQKLAQELQNLQRLHPTFVETIEYGKSLGGRPLLLVKLQAKNSKRIFNKLPAIYIGGSIHGDEYLNIEDRLPAWFADQVRQPSIIKKYIDLGGAIYVAPILNPDGYDKRRRHNDKGIDLNRDFTVLQAQTTGFTQPETKHLFNFLKSDLTKDARKLDLALDYHCCIGALLYPWSFTGPLLPPGEKEKHLKIGEIMQKSLGSNIPVGTTPILLGYNAKGTSKDFYYEQFGAKGFTYEGRYKEEDKYFDEHTQMWEQIIEQLLTDQTKRKRF